MSTYPSRFPTVFEHLAHRVDRTPERIALEDRIVDRRWTFEELASGVEDLREAFRGVDAPVALAVDNSSFCPWFFAARAAGRTVILVDAEHRADDKRELCRRLGVRFLVHDETVAAASTCGRGSSSPAVEELEGVSPAEPPPGTEIVKLTSGSTGAPSGACFAESELIVGVRQIGFGMGIDERDRVLLVLPLSHSYGFDNGPLSLALLGTPLVLERRILSGDLLRAVAETETTVLPLVPPLVRALGQARWPSLPRLRRVICAGGVLPAEAAEAFQRASGLPVHNFFGSSETGGICFETRPQESGAFGTVGSPLPGVTVDLGPSGAVRVRSAASLRAHWGDGDTRPAGEPVETGDLGEWTSDGRLRLVGRSADRLNVGGRKIAAAEIEEALRRLPGVTEAVVVGVPDEMRGDRVVAFLVAETWPVDLRAVPRRIRPRECVRLDALPVNGRGKVDRGALRRSLARSLRRSAEEQSPTAAAVP